MTGTSTATLAFFSDLLQKETGNTLDASKSYLIVGRLTPLARKMGYASLDSFAEAAGKPMRDHVTHLIVHGILHLLGYDHVRDKDATLMERTEVEILGKLGLPDPY